MATRYLYIHWCFETHLYQLEHSQTVLLSSYKILDGICSSYTLQTPPKFNILEVLIIDFMTKDQHYLNPVYFHQEYKLLTFGGREWGGLIPPHTHNKTKFKIIWQTWLLTKKVKNEKSSSFKMFCIKVDAAITCIESPGKCSSALMIQRKLFPIQILVAARFKIQCCTL